MLLIQKQISRAFHFDVTHQKIVLVQIVDSYCREYI